ncbi:CBS domain-containing protein [bacterium]|nr:CBS domain-containing protein [bacterium]
MKFETLKAKDIMISPVLTVAESSSLAETWKLFSENKITGAGVIDEEGEFVGVISQTDILRETAAESLEGFAHTLYYMELPYLEGNYWPSQTNTLEEITVGEVMNSEPVCADVSSTVPELATLMRNHKIHRVFITEKGKLAGIVSTMDMIKILECQ